mmetsp:Transcript_26754/g.84931  ORF Transcript_26754/g.84931 Transcript_26754/m.84931 type:complete len:220 (-) Transcript_26754:45-704(-)
MPTAPALPRDCTAPLRTLGCLSQLRRSARACRCCGWQALPTSPEACTAASRTPVSLWLILSAMSSACFSRASGERPASTRAARNAATLLQLRKGPRRTASPTAARHCTAAVRTSSSVSLESTDTRRSAIARAASRPSAPMARAASARTPLSSSAKDAARVLPRFCALFAVSGFDLPRVSAASFRTGASSSSSSLAISSEYSSTLPMMTRACSATFFSLT